MAVPGVSHQFKLADATHDGPKGAYIDNLILCYCYELYLFGNHAGGKINVFSVLQLS